MNLPVEEGSDAVVVGVVEDVGAVEVGVDEELPDPQLLRHLQRQRVNLLR